MMETEKFDVLDISVKSIMETSYFKVDKDEEWKVDYVNDLGDERDDRLLTRLFQIAVFGNQSSTSSLI